MNLIEVDDGGRWNIVDNTYNDNAWSRFTNKHSENLYIHIYIYIDMYKQVWNIYIEILWVFICETWPRIVVVSG